MPHILAYLDMFSGWGYLVPIAQRQGGKNKTKQNKQTKTKKQNKNKKTKQNKTKQNKTKQKQTNKHTNSGMVLRNSMKEKDSSVSCEEDKYWTSRSGFYQRIEAHWPDDKERTRELCIIFDKRYIRRTSINSSYAFVSLYGMVIKSFPWMGDRLYLYAAPSMPSITLWEIK